MTGGVPLLVDMLAEPFMKQDLSQEQCGSIYSESNLKQAVDYYYSLNSAMSYAWMHCEVDSTTASFY